MATENDTKRKITLHLYDTEMSVYVLPKDEEDYRKSAKLITDTVNTYASMFKGRKSDRDILYMGMLDLALRYVQESGRTDLTPLNDILTKLTDEIEEALKQ